MAGHGRKKKSIQMLLLGAFVLLLSVVYLVVKTVAPGDDSAGEEATGSDTEVLFQVETENAIKLSYQQQDTTVTLIKDEDSWVEQQNPEVPLEQSYIENMLSVFEGLEIKQTIWETRDQAAEYGLDSPTLQVTLTLSDGTLYSYQVGMEAVASIGGYYVMADGRDGIYLVDGKAYSAFSYTSEELIAMESAPEIEVENITRLSIKNKNEIVFDVSKEVAESDTNYDCWSLVKPYDTPVSGNTSAIEGMLSDYTSYSFSKMQEYACSDFSKYGLDNPQSQITIQYYEAEDSSDTKTFQLDIGSQEDGSYYVRMNDSNQVYVLAEATVDTLLGVSAYDYVSPNLLTKEFAAVKELHLTAKDLEVVLLKNDDGVTSNGTEIEEDTAKELYTKLTDLTIQGETKESVDKNEAILQVTVEDEQIIFRPYDENYYAVERNGATYFIVDLRSVEEIITLAKELD